MLEGQPPFPGVGRTRRVQRHRQVVALRPLGVVALHARRLHHQAHARAIGLLVGVGGEALAALYVVAALGGPVEVGVAAVVRHAVTPGLATALAGQEVAAVVVAREEGVQGVVDAGFLVLGGFAGQPGQRGGDARRQLGGEEGLQRRAAVVEHAVDAEIQLGGVKLEDVALEQFQEAVAGGAHGVLMG